MTQGTLPPVRGLLPLRRREFLIFIRMTAARDCRALEDENCLKYLELKNLGVPISVAPAVNTVRRAKDESVVASRSAEWHSSRQLKQLTQRNKLAVFAIDFIAN